MNPLINPNKRRVSLPKALADMLESIKPITATRTGNSCARGFLIHLLESRERGATELLIEPEPDCEVGCNVTERIGGEWSHVTTLVADSRSSLVAALVRMAAFTGEEFPGVGLLALQYKGKRLMWRIDMEAPDCQCVLTPLPQT
ncbi:MAG TPA: hypothetical protein VFE51_28485 [Verrucomicrobiae bacterium]|nr:hypothetical protein [Verrucomicrobiae bacterium]